MPKCDFNKVAWVFSCKFAAYLGTPLSGCSCPNDFTVAMDYFEFFEH